MKNFHIIRNDFSGLFMRLFYQLQHFLINIGSSISRTNERCVTAQISVVQCLQPHHVVPFTHTETCNHGPCQFCSLLDVIGSPCSHGLEHQFFGGTATGQCCYPVEQILLAHEQLFSAVDLHGVAQCTGRAGE